MAAFANIFATVRIVHTVDTGDRQRINPSQNPCKPRAGMGYFWRRPLVIA